MRELIQMINPRETPLIGPDSVFASLSWDIFVSVIMVIAGLFALGLGIKLLKKYQRNRSKAVLYLGWAMVVFVATMFMLVPTLFISGGVFKINDDLVVRLVGLAAITLYFMFAIEIFVMRGQKKQIHLIIPLVFVGINVALILINFGYVLTVFLDTGDINTFPTLLVIQEFIATIPFIYIFLYAWKLVRRTEGPEARALRYISLSGLFMFLSYLSLAIDDAIVLDNPSSLPMWLFALLGFIYFYIGVAKPKKVFKEADAKAS